MLGRFGKKRLALLIWLKAKFYKLYFCTLVK